MINKPSSKHLSDSEIDATVASVIEKATLTEKVAMMSGKGFLKNHQENDRLWGAVPYRAGAGCERLGIEALWFTDGPRGVARGQSTCFPVTMARGASWDRDLEHRIGQVIGFETKAQGCNLSGAVCINLLRHPGWGRAQETYSEDPYLLGEMGSALATGIQFHNVIATVKHFALNSLENNRFKININITQRTLHEVYLPHFKRVIDAGCASVMSAYNRINGDYCSHSRWLLTDILRHQWSFKGFVHSDWILGVYDPVAAAAGLDIENPEPVHFGERLMQAVTEGHIAEETINTACTRILKTLLTFSAAEDPLPDYPVSQVACEAHINLALEAAEKSAVLLKNNTLLPLKTLDVGVFGRLASIENTGDNGSSRVRPPYVVTPLAGIGNELGKPDLALAGDESDISDAVRAAKNVDVAIICVGLTADNEGEYIPGDIDLDQLKMAETDGMIREPVVSRGGDRVNLRLPPEQVKLIQAISAVNPNTVVVVIAGSAILMDEWCAEVPSIMQTFYSGMEGGTALANLLWGRVSPSGKLPFSVAMTEDDYPFFDPSASELDYGPLHGYTLLEQEGKTALFPFGHGLSYSQFGYRSLKLAKRKQTIEATVAITNTGSVTATEVAQLYISFPNSTVQRPKKLLKGFERATLAPGETQCVTFDVTLESLQYWCEITESWQFEHGQYRLWVGGSSCNNTLVYRDITL